MNLHTIYVIVFITVTILAIYLRGSATVSIKYKDNKPEPNPLKHPYRVSDNIDLYKDDKPADDDHSRCCFEPIKKEPFVMPKPIAVFLYLLPAMITDISLGLAYDTTLIGVGAKWGCLAASVITNVFFIACAIAHAETEVKTEAKT